MALLTSLRARWDRHVYPRLVDRVCGTQSIIEERARWVPRARGAVLEIGVGSGLNLPLLDAALVTSVVGLDPSAPLRARAADRASPVPLELVDGVAEAMPFDAARFDTVLLTYTLCSVGDPRRTLEEARRVLRPDGQLVFVEHGASPEPRRLRWQQRVTPVWRVVSGNCHLDRDVPALLAQSGFAVHELDARADGASWMSYAYSGIATPT